MNNSRIIIFTATALVALFMFARTSDACQGGGGTAKLSEPDLGRCKIDTDCQDFEACINRYKCAPVCDRFACGTKATCISKNHTRTCSCPDGYSGDPYYWCQFVCSTDDNCHDDEVCVGDQCFPVCAGSCGTEAICNAGSNHSHTCTCPAGYTGDPFRDCKPVCDSDNDCRGDAKCTDDHKCISLCGFSTCGKFATCTAAEHTYNCTCPTDSTGDPLVRCTKSCSKNTDCDWSEMCEDKKCIDGCDSLKCNERKQYCTIEEHIPKCHCIGGDHIPIALCDGQCDRDWDCHFTESCKNNQCIKRWGWDLPHSRKVADREIKF